MHRARYGAGGAITSVVSSRVPPSQCHGRRDVPGEGSQEFRREEGNLGPAGFLAYLMEKNFSLHQSLFRKVDRYPRENGGEISRGRDGNLLIFVEGWLLGVGLLEVEPG